MTASNEPAGDWAARQVRNTMNLAIWTGAWVASLAVATFGPSALWNGQPVPTLIAIGVNVGIGIGMLLAQKRYLLGLDELERTTQLQVMAVTLGVGLVGGLAWTMLDLHDLVGFEVGVAHVVVLMGVTYLVGSLIGSLRYR